MIKTDEHLTNYLLNNGEFPFKKRERFLFLLGDKTKEVLPLLKDLLNKLDIAIIKDVTILFFEDDGPINIKEIFKTISDDFGTNLHIHEAFTINKNIKGHLIIDYLEYVKKIKVLTKDYSSIVDVVLDSSELHLRNEFLKELKQMLIDPILNKSNNKEILEAFFKNDLNVLKTSKELYLNRNSLTNRLEIISRDLGINVQSFTSASIMLFLMNQSDK